MTKLSTFTLSVSLLALAAPQLAHASGKDQSMPGLTSTSVKATTQEDDLDAQIAAEETRQKQLQEEEKRQKLAALKAENDQKQQELTATQKVEREVNRVAKQVENEADRAAKKTKKFLKKGGF